MQEYSIVYLDNKWYLKDAAGNYYPYKLPSSGGGRMGVFVQDEGTSINGVFKTINFVGSSVTVTNENGVATVTIGSGVFVGGGGTLNYVAKWTPDGAHIGDSLLFDNGTTVQMGGTGAIASAQFALTSTTQGFLAPRMTTVNRDAIVAPATGLLVYNTSTSLFSYWDGAAWQNIDSQAGGDVSGSGTTNFVTKWTDGAGSVIGNSQVFDDGTNVGVGISAALLSKLHVAGAIRTGVASATNGSLVFQNSTNAFTLTINSGVTSASHSWTLPLAQGAASTFLMNDGAGVLSWSTMAAMGAFVQNGNSFGANAVLGTNDVFDLSFETSGVTRSTISSGGLWGINRAVVAGTLLSVQGTGTTSATFVADFYNSTPTALVRFRDDGHVSMGLANGSMTIGLGAGFISTLTNNTFIGVSAGAGITTGENNTALGTSSMTANTTGADNAAFGASSLSSNIISSFNAAFGKSALANCTNERNTGIGHSAGSGITTGDRNTAIGEQVMAGGPVTGSNNTGVGDIALISVTSGNQNQAVGRSALGSLTTGSFNTAIGDFAGFSATTNSSCVFLGSKAGYYETGSNKLFIDFTDRTSEALGRAKALVYGKFDVDTFNQVFNVNANLGIGIGDGAFGTSADFVLGIKNGTEPSTSPADMIQIFSVNVDTGGTNLASLGLRTEQAVEAIGVSVADTKLRVKINGTEYFLLLDTA